jgi:hypothetical protein
MKDFTYIILKNLAVKKEEITHDIGKRRETPDPGSGPAAGKSKSPLAAINDSAVAQKANQALKTVTGTAEKVQRTRLLRTCCAQPNALTTGWETSSARPSPTSRFCR